MDNACGVESMATGSSVQLVPLGPISVAAHSAPTLKAILGGLIVAVIGLAIAVCVLISRGRRLAR